MPEALPSRVDASRLAARGARLDNETPVAAMKRLHRALAGAEGSVASELAFARDFDDRITVTGHARAIVPVICQRCLEPMQLVLDAPIELTVLTDAEDADDGDTEVTVSSDGILSPLSLVEDELVLALPFAPKHGGSEGCDTPADAEPLESKRPNPFTVLKSLKTE